MSVSVYRHMVGALRVSSLYAAATPVRLSRFGTNAADDEYFCVRIREKTARSDIFSPDRKQEKTT